MDKHDIANFNLIEELNLYKPDSTYVDIGSNMGIYVNYFKRKIDINNDNSKIIAVELDIDNFKHLTANFGKLKNIVLHNAAVCDKDFDEIDYYKHNTHHQMSKIKTEFNQNMDGYTLAGQISQRTLDSLLSNEEKIHILKLDIEGGEFKAIDGMLETLAKTNIILYENHTEDCWNKIFPILIQNDFLVFGIEENKQRFIDDELKRSSYQSICIKRNIFKDLQNSVKNHWIFEASE